MNSKNELQELFQVKKLPLPIYDGKRVGGTDHKPAWISQVTLYDGRIFTSENSYGTRKEAEKVAAENALEALKSGTPTEKWMKSTTKRLFIFDVENNTRIVLDLIEKIKKIGPPPLSYLLLILSKKCPVVERIKADLALLKSSSIELSITDSIEQDAADMLIIIKSVQLAEMGMPIYIVTNDHFANTFKMVWNEFRSSNSSLITNLSSASEVSSYL